MSGPDEPYSPQFQVPPMTPVQPGGLDDPAERRQRMRRGILGAAIGLGIDLIIVVAAFVAGDTSQANVASSPQIILLAGTVLAGPIQIITGIILAAVQRTRPFGVGLLIGSALGLIIMAGACFAPLAVSG